MPEIVDEVNFEEIDVRLQSFPASQDFFDSDHGLFSNFYQREDVHDDEWEDEDDDDEEDDEDDEDEMYGHYGGRSEPECRQQ